jgi:hypothetical protein
MPNDDAIVVAEEGGIADVERDDFRVITFVATLGHGAGTQASKNR